MADIEDTASDMTGCLSEASEGVDDVSDPFALDGDDVPWFEREFMERADEEDHPVQGCALPPILEMFFGEENWQFCGNVHLRPSEIEHLRPYVKFGPPSQSSASASSVHLPPAFIRDDTAPLTERLADVLESMQPGFKQILLLGLGWFNSNVGAIT